VLSAYFDVESRAVDCISTDSVFCDQCKTSNGPRIRTMQGEQEEEHQEEEQEEQVPNGQDFIGQKLRAVEESYEDMIKVIDQLQGGECIYCTIMINEEEQGQLHRYSDCTEAKADGCGFAVYKQWRSGIDFGEAKHCWKCGLSQRICRRLERPGGQQQPCEYADIMLPSIFILHQRQQLKKLVLEVGF